MTLRIKTQELKKKGKKKGEAKGLIRRLGITHTQKLVSLLDTPQDLMLSTGNYGDLQKPLWQKKTNRADPLYVCVINESGGCTLDAKQKAAKSIYSDIVGMKLKTIKHCLVYSLQPS